MSEKIEGKPGGAGTAHAVSISASSRRRDQPKRDRTERAGCEVEKIWGVRWTRWERGEGSRHLSEG